MRLAWIPIAALLSLGSFAHAQANPADVPHSLTVSAQGQAKVLADTAIVTFEISGTDASSVGTAYQNAQSMSERLRTILAAQKFALDEAELTAYSVQTLYRNGPMQPLTVTGYDVTAIARLEITDFSRIGPLINALGDLPVIRSITFTAHNLEQAQKEAILDGYRKAHEQAQTMAAASNRSIGELESGTESVDILGGQYALAAPMAFGGGPVAPTEGYGTREVTVTARVTAVYPLAPAGGHL